MAIELIAVFHPAPGKTDRIVELLSGVAKIVEAKETGTLRYEIHKQIGAENPKVYVTERYTDKAALKQHGKFPEFAEMNKAFANEGLLADNLEIHVMTPAGGMASRL
ncbi:hypothetical protein BT63DRAFT_421792 [Microthyrium microscopicum]|uniref:ABM domain-containing protein n=1 Tax=Microthyrium microscopicum TaxID=703497 RepID=A0A6A6URG5_9PEZI|nr:hypothetical protein BT63DRAFT_421792 [Microthyrium microscopicum]